MSRIKAFLLIAAALVALTACDKRPESVFFYANTDTVAKAEIAKAVEAYNSQTERFIVELVDAAAERIDVTLGPYVEGGIAWRSISWRLWTRLETLAGAEGTLNRSIIRLLREDKMSAEDFASLAKELRALNIDPLIIPKIPASYTMALRRYLAYVAGEAAYDTWKESGLIREAADVRTAVNAIVSGQAAFIIASDQMGSWLGRSVDNHPESFSLPGSLTEASAWVIGRGENFVVAEKPNSDRAVIDFLSYLTSKGIAQNFEKTLNGTFYYWTEAPAKGQYPALIGPTDFLDPERP